MLRKNWDDLDMNGEKGDWCFFNDSQFLLLRFGDAIEDTVSLCVDGIARAGVNVWEWNGSKEAPTLKPSILVHGEAGKPDRFHGYLTDGKLTEV